MQFSFPKTNNNVILNTKYKKDPRIWWVLFQSLHGDGKYQNECAVRKKQSPEGASIFIPLEKGRFSLCYWKLEKARWGLWERSVAAQSIKAFKTEIWRRLSSLKHWGLVVNREKPRTKTGTLRKHIQFWWAARRDPLTKAEESHCQGYWSTSKEEQLPNVQLLPFSGKTDYVDRSLAKTITTDQKESLQIQYELLLLS